MAVLQQIKFRIISVGLVFAIGFCPAALSQELEQLREEVRKPTTQPKSKPKPSAQSTQRSKTHRSSSSKASLSSDSCDDDDVSSLWGGALMMGLSSPFWIPRSMVGDDSFDNGYFLRYPYLHKQNAAIDEYGYSPGINRHLMVRTRGEYANNFDSISKVGGSVLFDTSSRWGLDSEFNYRRENSQLLKDDLWTGDANVVFRFAQSEQVQMRTGIGCNWLSDRTKSDCGFNFTYGGDWFPAKPIIVSHEIDWGKLGHASLFHGRVTLGANYHRFEPYIGYEYFSVGKSDINSLVFGTRLWLSRF